MEKNIIIDLKDISVSFDGEPVLNNINLYIRDNEFITLLGPSGCGKTTTLRIIGGFLKPDTGRVIFNGEDITNLPPNKRQLNTVFQNYALFPNLTIAENIAFGLKIKKKSKDYINDKIKYALKLVNLEGYEDRMPQSLSGGQQQRIAIARAIVNEPKVLLLDEPLGALDLQLRRQMQHELKRLQKKLGITFIYITHDQEEALNMSDLIAVMNGGHFEQIGSPEEIYEHPTTRFAAQFIGQSNILEGKVVSSGEDRSVVELCPGNAVVVKGAYAPGERLALSVRAERIDYANEAAYGFHLTGVIKLHSYIGGVLRTTITLPTGQELLITGANPVSLYPAGCTVQVFWDPEVAAVVERGEG